MSTELHRIETLTDDDLEEINRLWTVVRVFSNTAHDINNALQVISGSAELLESTADPVPTLQRRVTAIRTQAGRAAQAVETLLSYSRGARETVKPADLAGLVAMAVTMRDCTLRRVRIAVTVERSDEAPFWVPVARWKALQLLLNLLLNAERALTAHDDARIMIRLDRRRDGPDGPDHIDLSVTGTGEPPRGAHASELPPAAGPGPARAAAADTELWAAARLAVGQGGRLDVGTEPGLATSVRLTLPAAPGL